VNRNVIRGIVPHVIHLTGKAAMEPFLRFSCQKKMIKKTLLIRKEMNRKNCNSLVTSERLNSSGMNPSAKQPTNIATDIKVTVQPPSMSASTITAWWRSVVLSRCRWMCPPHAAHPSPSARLQHPDTGDRSSRPQHALLQSPACVPPKQGTRCWLDEIVL